MDSIFVKKIIINKVRHLENVEITLSDQEKKHLIITGKNGSGKTSLLNSIAVYLNSPDLLEPFQEQKEELQCEISLDHDMIIESHKINGEIGQTERIVAYAKALGCKAGMVKLEMSVGEDIVCPVFLKGRFIVAYYRADRIFEAEVPKHIEKVQLKKNYQIDESPREEFVKYLLDLKMTEALAKSGGKQEKAKKIDLWFQELEGLLKKIFENDSLTLEFDEDTFQFSLHMEGREPFDFNTLSSGYAAILDIVIDLIMRMEIYSNRRFEFSIPGIVLIDEIETHLHLELQRTILPVLTKLFPNIQFIVSTHSPFILNSLPSAVIYDLENKIMVKNGLADIPYSGIVEGYFKSDELSDELRKKFNRYKALAAQTQFSDDDMEEIADLEMYLDEIPDYLALNITTEYQRLKQLFRKREEL